MKKTKHFDKIKFLSLAIMGVGFVGTAQNDWDNIPVPANAGQGMQWELQEQTSDNFNYKFDAVNRRANFGNGKWYNFYHNAWDGPGTTYWKNNHVSVEGGSLKLTASRWNKNNQPNPQYPYPGARDAFKMDLPNNGVNSGCVTSNSKVKFPVFVESAISVANIELASCFWLLSPDDTQEIDIIENYGGVPGFDHVTHISHHSFIRNPFHDYQPRDWNSWWPDARVNKNYGWGDWAWNEGNRRFLRLGVNWISPKHFEYYVDGEIVRVLYNDAIATRMNGTWEYTYYVQQNPANTKASSGRNIGGMPINYASGNRNGYSQVTLHDTSSSFNFSKLKEASKASNGINVIDPGSYQNGRGFHKEMDIIINVESQSWLVSRELTPSDSNLNDPSRNSMLVDWVRVYKPVQGVNKPAPVVLNGGKLTGGPYTFTVGDGIADNVSGVSVSGNEGPNTGWVVTDEALNILGTPPTPAAVNFDGAGPGVCLIWHIAYEDGLEGLSAGSKIADLKGNYDLSDNSVRINRNEFVAPVALNGGTLTGGPYTFTVGDGIADNVSGVSVSGNEGPNTGWVVTDEALNILGTPPTPAAVNFDGAGPGVCLIWHIAYEDGLEGLSAGSKIADLKGSYDLSNNSVRINRNEFVEPVVGLNGGTLTGGPYTFTVGDGIADNVSGVSVSGNEGPNTGWVVTDEALNILGTPPTPAAVNFDGAGPGVCLIWHIAYEDGLEGLAAGGKIADLKGKYDLSDNSVRIIRNEVITPDTGDTPNANSTVIQAEDFIETGGAFNGWEIYTTSAGVKGTNFNQTGDWAEYNMTITEEGLYDLTYFVGTVLDNTAISLYIDGIFVAKTGVYNNGDWDTFVKLPLASPFNIGVGEHTVRLVGSGTSTSKYEWNMDYFEVTRVGDFIDPTVVDLDIEAESFVNTGGNFEGFEIYTTPAGVKATNFNQTGDWAEYNVNIPATGDYDITYFISTPLNNTAVEFIVDGVSQMTDNVPNNNSWDNFRSLQSSKTVFLTEGSHVIRLQGAGRNAIKWEWNLDRFNIATAGSKTAAKALDTIDADLIKITPNPVVDFFTVIGLDADTVLNYAIIDMVGGVIKTGILTTEANEVNGLNELAQGVYFVKIYNEIGFKKVIKVLKK